MRRSQSMFRPSERSHEVAVVVILMSEARSGRLATSVKHRVAEGRHRLGIYWQAGGSRADPHCHIVFTFEAKESGAPGVLAQNLGISGRLECADVLCD